MEAEAEVGEVVSGRRRYWTAEEKRRIVELTLSSSESVASLARRLSREFYEVMILAATTELWKCVRSTNAE
jgi:hypothetical protein